MSSEEAEKQAPPAAPEEGGQEEEVRPWQMRLCHLFMLTVVLRLPFFIVPCAKGTCTSPLEVVASELYSYDKAPHGIIRALLFPGAIAEYLQHTILSQPASFPQWENLLDNYKNTTMKDARAQPFPTSWELFKELQMDLIGGSFVVALGAIMAMSGPNTGSTFGLALLYMFVVREKAPIFSYMVFATVCSCSWLPLHKLFERRTWKRKAREVPGRARVAAATPAEKKRMLRTKGKFKVY